jgi:hypothetical protein
MLFTVFFFNTEGAEERRIRSLYRTIPFSVSSVAPLFSVFKKMRLRHPCCARFPPIVRRLTFWTTPLTDESHRHGHRSRQVGGKRGRI